MARPTDYTEQLADQICEQIATSSKALKTLCNEFEAFPSPSTVYLWLTKYPEFSEKYARAREQQADFLVDEILEIADDGSNDTIQGKYGPVENTEWTSRSKLRVEARKWAASKKAPKKYGDKLDVTSGGETVKQVFQINGTTIEL